MPPNESSSKKIFLTGFMGVGKTYWGQLVSKELALKFLDLDQFIEEKESSSIPIIIKEQGEKAFRVIESKWLKYLIENTDARIISLGGGTLIRKKNLILVKNHGALIWLKKNSLQLRGKDQEKQRPLYDKSELDQLYHKRKSAYIKSDHIVNLDNYENNKSIQENLIKYIRYTLNL